MSSYDSKSSLVLDRQLKVQRLVIPFTIVGNATPADKTRSVDEPSILFLSLEGTGQNDITAALDGDTITYTDAPADSTGIFNVYMKVGEVVSKICSARCQRLSTTLTDADDVCTVALGDANGLSADGNIGLTVDCAQALTSGTHNLVLQVEYIVAE